MNHTMNSSKNAGDFFAFCRCMKKIQVQEPLLSKWGFDPSEEGLAEAMESHESFHGFFDGDLYRWDFMGFNEMGFK